MCTYSTDTKTRIEGRVVEECERSHTEKERVASLSRKMENKRQRMRKTWMTHRHSSVPSECSEAVYTGI